MHCNMRPQMFVQLQVARMCINVDVEAVNEKMVKDLSRRKEEWKFMVAKKYQALDATSKGFSWREQQSALHEEMNKQVMAELNVQLTRARKDLFSEFINTLGGNPKLFSDPEVPHHQRRFSMSCYQNPSSPEGWALFRVLAGIKTFLLEEDLAFTVKEGVRLLHQLPAECLPVLPVQVALRYFLQMFQMDDECLSRELSELGVPICNRTFMPTGLEVLRKRMQAEFQLALSRSYVSSREGPRSPLPPPVLSPSTPRQRASRQAAKGRRVPAVPHGCG